MTEFQDRADRHYNLIDTNVLKRQRGERSSSGTLVTPSAQGETTTPTGGESSFGFAELNLGVNALSSTLNSLSVAKQYESQAAQYAGAAEMAKIGTLSYEEQAQFAEEDAARQAGIKELEGDFKYGDQVLQAQSTGLLSGQESFMGTGVGAVVQGTRNTFRQEAEEIIERGRRLKLGYLRKAGASRRAEEQYRQGAEAAKDAEGKKKLEAAGKAAGTAAGYYFGGPVGAAVGSTVGSLIDDVPVVGDVLGGFFD